MNQQKFIEPVDREVGARVRARRRLLGISQTGLAGRIGVTFQQVQKYEKGTNRISASRMQQIAAALNLSAAMFFGNGTNEEHPDFGQLVSDSVVSSKEALALNRAVARIKDPSVRSAVIELVLTLAGGEEMLAVTYRRGYRALT